MYVNQGMSMSAVAKSLNAQNIPTKHNSFWTSGAILNTLRNCNYIGYVRYCMYTPERRFETEGLHEAIISEELFNAAQVLREKQSRIAPTKKPNENNYFNGLVYCHKCGARLQPNNIPSRKKDSKDKYEHNYVCVRKSNRACDAMQVSRNKLEAALLDYFSNIEDIDALDKINMEEQQQQARDYAEQIQALQNKLKQLDTKDKEVMSLFIDNHLDFEAYRNMKGKLDNDRAFINSELAKLTEYETTETPTGNLKEIIADFRNNWEHLTSAEKRLFLTNVIKKIVVKNERQEGKFRGTTSIVHIDFN